MTRQCGCLGGNQNCTFCYGSGYIDAPPLAPISIRRRESEGRSWAAKRTQRLKETPQNPNRQSTVVRPYAVPASPQALMRQMHSLEPDGGVYCAYCKAVFASDAPREEHVRSEHVADASEPEAKQLLKPLLNIKGILFEQKKYSRTAIPTPGSASSPQAKQQKIGRQSALKQGERTAALVKPTALRVPSGSDLVICPDCKTNVRIDRIEKHRQRVHNSRSSSLAVRQIEPNTTGRQSSARNKPACLCLWPPGGVEHEDQLRPDNYREERRLDGARDSWRIRDNGQFGSYPSFDACDDEADP
jgi:hypothetical protein